MFGTKVIAHTVTDVSALCGRTMPGWDDVLRHERECADCLRMMSIARDEDRGMESLLRGLFGEN